MARGTCGRLAFAAVMLAGCNAILGIDEAELAPEQPGMAGQSGAVGGMTGGGTGGAGGILSETMGASGSGAGGPGSGPVELTGAVQVAAGQYHTCALLEDARVVCWGSDRYGELGTEGASPVVQDEAKRPLTGVLQIAANVGTFGGRSCALLEGGRVLCWGRPEGVVQPGEPSPPWSIRDASGRDLLGIASLAMGDEHACGLMADGRVCCWGANEYGQAGVAAGDGVEYVTSCVKDEQGNDLTGVQQVACGESHSCALLNDGRVLCWGRNGSGQLGTETDVGSGNPHPVPSFVEDEAGTPLADVQHIALGRQHSCAVSKDGGVLCWGDNYSGELGLGPNGGAGGGGGAAGAGGGDPAFQCDPESAFYSCRSTHARRVKDELGASLTGAQKVALGEGFSCAMLEGGRVRCWGDNSNGQLGNAINQGEYGQNPVPLWVVGDGGDLTGAKGLSLGSRHACVVTDGRRVLCWGGNTFGQLGNGLTSGDRPKPAPVLIAWD